MDTVLILDSLFGPIGKDACIYFYALSVISAVVFLLSFGFFVKNVMSVGKINHTQLHFIVIMSQSALAYFVNRVLNTMCVRSLV